MVATILQALKTNERNKAGPKETERVSYVGIYEWKKKFMIGIKFIQKI